MKNETKREFFSPLLGERYACYHHKSGLNIYCFPKKTTNVYALFAVKYGSIDTVLPGDATQEPLVMPDGVAHFLEHKLFENEDGSDSFVRFSAMGADANAYTDYNRTAYLFHCTDHLADNLRELLSFVTHPYFTDATVKKEQGIIAEEIRMYDDQPWDRVYQNLLKILYHTHPVRNNICGSIESIGRITPELLYRAHKCFYNLSNMALVLCGNMDEDEVLAIADEVLTGERCEVRLRCAENETDAPARSYIEDRMPLSKPIFQLGIKDSVIPESAEGRLRRDFVMTMLNELLFSHSGAFYSALFEEGLLMPSFSHGYSSADGFAYNCISGESEDPREVVKRFWEYIEHVKQTGLSDADVERVRRVLYADEIRAYDSTEEIANRLLSFVFDGIELFSAPEIIRSVTKEELTEVLHGFYQQSQSALSVVYPLPEEAESGGIYE